MLRRRYEAMLLIQFMGGQHAYSSIDSLLSRLRSLAMRAAEPALVGEFHSAKDQGAVAVMRSAPVRPLSPGSVAHR